MIDFITQNYKQTQKLAEIFAKEIAAAKPSAETAFIVALTGDLGSGKTTFTQGFVKGFGIKEKITSPTFVLMHRHKIKQLGSSTPKFKNLYHFDCYRLGKPEEILTLGFEEIIKNPRNVVLIEWADKIAKIFPEKILKIKFKWLGENKRKIEFSE
mgnify:CR=1 FL=1